MNDQMNGADNVSKKNETLTLNNEKKISYHQYGLNAARDTNSNPANIESSLHYVYDQFLNEQQLNEDGIKQRIARLRAEILQKKNQQNTIQSEIKALDSNKSEWEKKIEELEIEKIKVKSGDAPTNDYVPFVIGTFIVILLTLYLFVFYSSSGYSAFYGVQEGSLGFINANVFAEAKNKGGGLLAMIILFPVIFLGLGFLIHDALDKRKYLFIFGLLSFTLIVDAIIGYKIAQSIHNNEFSAGLNNELWNFSMIYTDINFYLVLALGFVVYVIWGALLHYVLNKYIELQPDKIIELKINNIDIKLNDLKKTLSEMISKISSLHAQISTLDNEIQDKEKDIIGYENGVIPINISLLQASVGEFMNGWYAYTNMMFENDADKRTETAKAIQNKWMNLKIEGLK